MQPALLDGTTTLRNACLSKGGLSKWDSWTCWIATLAAGWCRCEKARKEDPKAAQLAAPNAYYYMFAVDEYGTLVLDETYHRWRRELLVENMLLQMYGN